MHREAGTLANKQGGRKAVRKTNKNTGRRVRGNSKTAGN